MAVIDEKVKSHNNVEEIIDKYSQLSSAIGLLPNQELAASCLTIVHFKMFDDIVSFHFHQQHLPKLKGIVVSGLIGILYYKINQKVQSFMDHNSFALLFAGTLSSAGLAAFTMTYSGHLINEVCNKCTSIEEMTLENFLKTIELKFSELNFSEVVTNLVSNNKLFKNIL